MASGPEILNCMCSLASTENCDTKKNFFSDEHLYDSCSRGRNYFRFFFHFFFLVDWSSLAEGMISKAKFKKLKGLVRAFFTF